MSCRVARRSILSVVLGAVVLAAHAQSADDLLALGRTHVEAREYDQAIAVLRKAEKLRSDFTVKAMLADAYNRVGAYKPARRTAGQAHELSTDDFERAVAENLWGIALFAGGSGGEEQLEEAADRFDRAIEGSGGQLSAAYLSRAEVLLQLGRDEQAVPLLESFLESEPRDRAKRGRALALLENPSSARTPALPSFGAALLDGEYLTDEDLQGKVVLFDFWGTWCEPCRAAIPHLKRLAKRRAKMPFEIVSVSSDKEVAKVRSFVAEHGMDWPQVWEQDQELISKLQVRSYPTYILVDHEGQIVFRDSGWSTRMAERIDEQLSRAVRVFRKASRRAND